MLRCTGRWWAPEKKETSVKQRSNETSKSSKQTAKKFGCFDNSKPLHSTSGTLDEWTLATFKSDFVLANKERVRRLTAGDAGFHGAHAATTPPATPTTPVPAVAAAAVTPTPNPTAPPAARHVSVEGGKMYYCWSHGLSPHRNHTSLSCHNKAEGHQDTATACSMQGGNNTISSGRPRRIANARNACAAASTALNEFYCVCVILGYGQTVWDFSGLSL